MSQIISVSIDLNKIDKSKIKTTDKNGQPFAKGQKYLELSVNVNDQADQYGNNVSVTHAQTKEEREAKVDRIFLGNGKVVWSSAPRAAAPERDAADYGLHQDNNRPAPTPPPTGESDDLPF